jgi:hypothetical protein
MRTHKKSSFPANGKLPYYLIKVNNHTPGTMNSSRSCVPSVKKVIHSIGTIPGIRYKLIRFMKSIRCGVETEVVGHTNLLWKPVTTK